MVAAREGRIGMNVDAARAKTASNMAKLGQCGVKYRDAAVDQNVGLASVVVPDDRMRTLRVWLVTRKLRGRGAGNGVS